MNQERGPESPEGGPAGAGSQKDRWVDGDLEAGADRRGSGGNGGAAGDDAGTSGSAEAAGSERDSGGRPDLAADLRALGENLRDALRAAWTSQERERIQSEIELGVRQLGQAISQTFEEGTREFRSGRVKERMAGVKEDLRSRPLGDRAVAELHEMLTKVNQQVRQARDRWTPRGGSASGGAEPGRGEETVGL